MSMLRAYLTALALAFATLIGVERGFHTYLWAGEVNRKAVAAHAFLASPILDPATKQPLRAPNGAVLTHADGLVILLNAQIKAERQRVSAGSPVAGNR
jgi:hypothetical protein